MGILRATTILSIVAASLALSNASAYADEIDWASIPYTDISAMQVVNASGGPAFSPAGFPLKIRGVLLNNPEDMLDSSVPHIPPAGPFDLGAMWQVFVQSVDVNNTGDFGGVAAFMGQSYGNVPPNLTFPGGVPTPDPSANYSDADWLDEIDRLNYDGDHLLRAGDLVEIRATTGLFFGGKFNVNESHQTDPDFDFEIIYLGSPGLPEATPLTLASIWNEGTNSVLFDQTRQTGGEHYQGQLVELQSVSLAPGSAWGAGELATIVDAQGRTLSLNLGLDPAFDSLGKPVGTFDIVGIFNQEAPSGGPFTGGYQLWTMNPSDFKFTGDANGDGYVDGVDYVAWASHFKASGSLAEGDFNGDGFVDGIDYIAWASNFHNGFERNLAAAMPVPEPGTFVLALVAALGLIGMRRRRS